MSRIGKLPIAVPSGVTITVDPGEVTVAGSKGTLKQFTLPGITIVQEDNVVTFARENDEPKNRAKHGLMRALVNNMVIGVSTGFSKKLEINGVGYRVASQGSDLKLNLGFSHDVIFPIPAGITASLEQNTITISGSQSHIRAKVLSTQANTSSARAVSQERRSSHG
jgi:large subunit ribosomal protein L6